MTLEIYDKLDGCEYLIRFVTEEEGEPICHTCALIDAGVDCPYSSRQCAFKYEQEELRNYMVSVCMKTLKGD